MDIKQVYETVCAALDERKWTYNKDEENNVIYLGVNGENMPLRLVIIVDANRQLVRIMSPLPFKIDEDKRMDAALAVCVANYGIVDGSFDYDISDGAISFRLTAGFCGCEVTKSLMQYMIQCTCVSVENYNHRFLALNKGVIGIAEFIQQES